MARHAIAFLAASGRREQLDRVCIAMVAGRPPPSAWESCFKFVRRKFIFHKQRLGKTNNRCAAVTFPLRTKAEVL